MELEKVAQRLRELRTNAVSQAVQARREAFQLHTTRPPERISGEKRPMPAIASN